MQNMVIVEPQDAARELLARTHARKSLLGFCTYTKPNYQIDPLHELIAEELEMVERGETKRLMIFCPPRLGKSETATRRFPAWFRGRNPQKNIISASYNADFAKGFGRNVRDIVESPSYARLFPDVQIRSDNRSAIEWEVEQGGQYYAVGVGSSTTGRGAHLFLIDDPIKDRKEADSFSIREDQWNWYRDVVYTRLEEDAAVVITLTRWHYDDLAGRNLELMKDGRGVPWRVVSVPAFPLVKYHPISGLPILDEEGRVPTDPLLRKPGESPAPNRISAQSLKDRQEVLGERSWSALYMQQPITTEGALLKSSMFPIIDNLPDRRSRVRAWDLAATNDGDWTVGALMSRDLAGVFYIENIVRFRGTPLEVERRLQQVAREDGRGVAINLPQDPGQAGVVQSANLIRRLAGFRVKAVRASGRKETRAAGFVAQAEAQNVKLLRGAWNQTFLEEAEVFPLGTHDDQIDACADAFNALLGSRKASIANW